jgi:hypothetical protein
LQNELARGRQLCTPLSIFEGSLAEFFRFWCCQLRKMTKSRRIASCLTLSSWNIDEVRRIASFFMLSTLKNDEVSQNCFVFDVANFNIFSKSRRLAALLMLSSSKMEEA